MQNAPLVFNFPIGYYSNNSNSLSVSRTFETPKKIWKKAAELGFIGIHFPEEYSGMGLGCLENILVAEELTRGDSSVGACLLLADFASEIILHNGSEEQKTKWLPKVAEGECLSCGAITEPDYGSDNQLPYEGSEGGLKLAVERKGDGYVLNGTKQFIALGAVASLYIVSGRTDRTVPVRQGTSRFLVPRDTPGFSVTRVHDKVGWRAYGNGELAFEDVFVPKENLLGGEENVLVASVDVVQHALANEVTADGKALQIVLL